ncbi:hypothetical protein M0R45_001194 [Rubus argutus]|uniref:Auxin response factor n=1 Tax=Rubus argutus TaxID=59490 RepID=A0AAW1VM74_RUBAR
MCKSKPAKNVPPLEPSLAEQQLQTRPRCTSATPPLSLVCKLLLQSVFSGLSPTHRKLSEAAEEDEEDDGNRVVSSAKILTPSYANNGGGFSFPRFCADSIFPPLNYLAEPPVQTLSATDLHGVVCDFLHIYCGTPRRHLFTTGWSKFVNQKMLVAGDSVVFMRSSRREEMYVGVRRTVRESPGGDCGWWSAHIALKSEEEGSGRDGFKTRLSAEAVAEATEMAAQDMPLEVFWTAGMRVKMAMEIDDSSRMTWFQGTLAFVSVPDNGPWQGFPWRMLPVFVLQLLSSFTFILELNLYSLDVEAITWHYKLHVLRVVISFSLMQASETHFDVYGVASTHSLHNAPSLHTVFPPTKRFRAPLNPGLLRNGEEEFMIPMTGAANSIMGKFNASLLKCNNFSCWHAGSQARSILCIDAVGCTGEGGNIGYNESELLNNQLDLSYTKLLKGLTFESRPLKLVFVNYLRQLCPADKLLNSHIISGLSSYQVDVILISYDKAVHSENYL